MRERQHMFQIHREELDWAGRKLVIETGKIARQADGAVFASWGETTLLATVVAAKAPKPGQDFFPLTVNYQEKAFAADASPAAISSAKGAPRARDLSLASDRPPDPSAVPRWLPQRDAGDRHVLSHDLENDPTFSRWSRPPPPNAVRSALHGPIGAARVGHINGALKVNPTIEEMKNSILDLVVAGTGDAVLMVESEARAFRGYDARSRHGRPSRFPAGDRPIIRLAERAPRTARLRRSR